MEAGAPRYGGGAHNSHLGVKVSVTGVLSGEGGELPPRLMPLTYSGTPFRARDRPSIGEDRVHGGGVMPTHNRRKHKERVRGRPVSVPRRVTNEGEKRDRVPVLTWAGKKEAKALRQDLN